MGGKRETEVIVLEQIEPRILVVRGQRVMLDAALAELYGTSTKRLNEQVRRNLGRFPADFMFRLTAEEAGSLRLQTAANLRSQSATSSSASHGGRRYLPYAFTEHGALMAASVLNTPRAMEVSVYVIRAFVKLRELLSTRRELAEKVAELERKVMSHDEAIRSLVAAIRQLTEPAKRPQIGFHAGRETK
jgi:hypothetical protein